MSTQIRRRMINAACVTLFKRPGHVLLIQRSTGQWAVPGGKFDKKLDMNLQQTAMRELYEETNIRVEVEEDPFFVHLVGKEFMLHHFWAKKILGGLDAIPLDDAIQCEWVPIHQVINDNDSARFVPLLSTVLNKALDRLASGECILPEQANREV